MRAWRRGTTRSLRWSSPKSRTNPWCSTSPTWTEEPAAALDQIETEIEPIASLEAAVIDEVAPAQEIAQDEVAIEEIPAVEAIALETQIETGIAGEIATIEPIAEVPLRRTSTSSKSASVAVEPATETVTLSTLEPVAAIEVPVEIQSAAAAPALPDNVVALAERRAALRKGRPAIVRAGRWAAAIMLIVAVCALAAKCSKMIERIEYSFQNISSYQRDW